MSETLSPDLLTGVWSAAPTPFTDKWRVDAGSVKRMVDHHARLGVKGLFLAGSCGEGPWMTADQRRRLVEVAAEHNRGRMVIAAQVSDNSAPRILENVEAMRQAGAQIAVMTAPFHHLHPTPAVLLALYQEVLRNSPLPVGLYDLGVRMKVVVPETVLAKLCREPRVVLIKDSSGDPARGEVALAARRQRPDLRVLNGNEFACPDFLERGYDGLLLGGAVFNGSLANGIVTAMAAGDRREADRLQARMNRLMFAVYGGPKITTWLAGLKHLLVRMGIFRTEHNYLGYTLTAPCRRAIEKVLIEEAKALFPWRASPPNPLPLQGRGS